MIIAVTGGNGELGRSLLPYLLGEGHQLISIDRALPSNIGLPGDPRVRALVADTRDFGELVGAMRGAEALVHLAAHRVPTHHPDTVVYHDNTSSSYNALAAAATLGIRRVCLASSINAVGAAFSRAPRYDYFPLDEAHPTYAEDPYSLSKWVLEQQADAFARRYAEMRIASLRFHWLLDNAALAAQYAQQDRAAAARHLWAWTALEAACRACLLALKADFAGHEVFFITAPTTTAPEPSRELARRHYPGAEIRGELAGNTAFFDCGKAERLLGWRHER
jgi:UDP-glucose 4-epimerase